MCWGCRQHEATPCASCGTMIDVERVKREPLIKLCGRPECARERRRQLNRKTTYEARTCVVCKTPVERERVERAPNVKTCGDACSAQHTRALRTQAQRGYRQRQSA